LQGDHPANHVDGAFEIGGTAGVEEADGVGERILGAVDEAAG